MLNKFKKFIPNKMKLHIKKIVPNFIKQYMANIKKDRLKYEFINIKESIVRNKNNNLILVGSPDYGNLGDQAICIAILNILHKVSDGKKNVVEIPAYLYRFYNEEFVNIISEEDIIYTIGGGNLGNLYDGEEHLRKDIIWRFPLNKIIVMPQSIYFTKDDLGLKALENSKKIYCNHKNLHLITRDEASFSFAKKEFSGINNYLLPDSVIVLENELQLEKINREGITFFLRNDKEKVLDDKFIADILKVLDDKKVIYQISDTTVPYGVNKDNRMDEVMKKINLANSSKLVITDRFHGLIFSVITHTPVIVFKSFDTKISEGVKWFKDLDYVHYMEYNAREVKELLMKYLSNDVIINKNSSCKDILLNNIRNIS